ncbi:cellulase family glycosylhydrolase [Ferruginibacter sp. HRS2-29]|uniref:cellulase family glycosylhydrolase n=1 Tax=Ferruginibacter sp. HRS2-29 TaxID=2487334 RepID=UPI0020CEB223|nr:cellulase family glycosylhydrolase [Ferruginibacter sp. HRS2-29]MCP9749645.1 carbohydrate-binding protein [Ferruginibacter sp. HRS2-29]
MRYFIISMLLLAGITSKSQGFLKADGPAIKNGRGQEIILRGMGLGGWMLQEPYMMQLSGFAATQHDIRRNITDLVGEKGAQKFYDAWLANHCTKADVDSMAAWGFNSIRLPMHYNLYTLPIEKEPVAGKQTWIEKGFRMTDSLLSWCKANKIYLILDLHAAPGGQGNDIAISDRDTSTPHLWKSQQNQQKTIALWEKLAARYANEEWIGAYDLINEPNYGFQDAADKNGCAETENAPLRKLYVDLTTAIRKVDKKHIIIIEGNCWGNNYAGIFPLWDNNMVLSFHKYWNNTSDGSIQKFLDYRTQYNVPIWLGESGENSNSWMTETLAMVERNKIGWALWPLKKSGPNNPLQVKINPGYRKILNYWKDQGPKPTPEEALAGLMEYASATKISNNIYNKNVTDALIRQTGTWDVIPYKDFSVKNDAVLFASDYDLGRSGLAYHDKDSATYWVEDTRHQEWNSGHQYRNEGVDIEACTDSVTNGYNVGWIQDGEWMQYTIYSPQNGTFDVNVRSASKLADGRLQLLVNDLAAGENIVLPNTGEDQRWATSTIKNISLNKGWNRLRVLAVKGGFNLNYLQFRQTNGTAAVN